MPPESSDAQRAFVSFLVFLVLVVLVGLAASGVAAGAAGAARLGRHVSARYHRASRHQAKPRRLTHGASFPAGYCADGDLLPTAANLARIREAALCLINQQRRIHGLLPLRETFALQARAQRRSADLVVQNYFADRLAAGGVVHVGENIAAGTGPQATPAGAVAMWMDSPPHRANILDRAFRETGIGAVAAAPAVLAFGGTAATYTERFSAAS